MFVKLSLTDLITIKAACITERKDWMRSAHSGHRHNRPEWPTVCVEHAKDCVHITVKMAQLIRMEYAEILK